MQCFEGFQNIELDSVKATVFNLVKDPNLHVAALAAELIGRKGKKKNYTTIKHWQRRNLTGG